MTITVTQNGKPAGSPCHESGRRPPAVKGSAASRPARWAPLTAERLSTAHYGLRAPAKKCQRAGRGVDCPKR
jgi:hypothetical protein